MDWNEFHDHWLPGHIAKFPGLVKWLSQFPVDKRPQDASPVPTRRAILEAWQRTLSPYTVEQATEATDALGGDDHPEPHGWDRHPLAIAAICQRAKRARSERPHPVTRIRDGHALYACPVCRDTGDLTVWHPRTMQAARDGLLHTMAERGELYSVSVACASCETFSPARYSELRFDPARMLPAPTELCGGIEELQAFVDARTVQRRTWTPDGALEHLGDF